MNYRMTIAVASSLALLVGCSSSSSNGSPSKDAGPADAFVGLDGDALDTSFPPVDGGAIDAPSPTDLSPGDFEAARAKLDCQFMVRCGFLGAAEEAACEAAIDAQKGVTLPYASPEAVSAGRLGYDPKTAADCLDRTKTKGCTAEQQFAVGTVCDAVYSAAVAIGGACRARPECKDGYCDRAKYARDGCAGTCVAFTAVGAACDPTLTQCAPTAFCDGTAKKCVARSDKGAACGDNGPFCSSGLSCVAGVCSGQSALGAACVFNLFGSSCTPGLFCDGSGASPVCAARHDAGATCASFDGCNDGLDCIGLAFDDTGAVTASGKCKPYLDVASACTPSAAETGCPGGTTCDATAKTCARIGFEGAACGGATNADCRDGLYCEGASSTCKPRIAVGLACIVPASSASNPCTASTQCDATSHTCALICQ